MAELTAAQDEARREGLFHRLAELDQECTTYSRWLRMNGRAGRLVQLEDNIASADSEERRQDLRREMVVEETKLNKTISSRPAAASLSHPAHLLSPRQRSFYLL